MIAAGLMLAALAGCSPDRPRRGAVLRPGQGVRGGRSGQFREKTGLEATPKFDTEADKSVSLFNELEEEKDRPRCDVFWNNETALDDPPAAGGSPGAVRQPIGGGVSRVGRDKDHYWTAFANRARVLLVNTDQLVAEADRPKSLLDLTDAKWKGRVAMARPTVRHVGDAGGVSF